MLLFPSYFVSFPADFIEHKCIYCARFNIRRVKYQPFGLSSIKLHILFVTLMIWLNELRPSWKTEINWLKLSYSAFSGKIRWIEIKSPVDVDVFIHDKNQNKIHAELASRIRFDGEF